LEGVGEEWREEREEGEVELSERDTLVGYMFLLQNLKRRCEEELTEMERQALDFALWLLYERLHEEVEELSKEDLAEVRSVRELIERRRAADAQRKGASG